MPRLEFSDRFADDLSRVTSCKVEVNIYAALDNVEAFGEFGSRLIPDSILRVFDEGVRKVVVSSFDLICTYYSEKDLIAIEALIGRRMAR